MSGLGNAVRRRLPTVSLYLPMPLRAIARPCPRGSCSRSAIGGMHFSVAESATMPAMRPISAAWQTLALPSRLFRQVARPLDEMFAIPESVEKAPLNSLEPPALPARIKRNVPRLCQPCESRITVITAFSHNPVAPPDRREATFEVVLSTTATAASDPLPIASVLDLAAMTLAVWADAAAVFA